MRYRFMATYRGVPYHAGLGPDGSEVTLFSPGPPPEELGFTRHAGHWRRKVDIADITALWQSRLVGEYRGERCLVLDDLGDRLHIAFLGRDGKGKRRRSGSRTQTATLGPNGTATFTFTINTKNTSAGDFNVLKG